MNKNLIWIVVGIAVLYFLSTLKKGIIPPGKGATDYYGFGEGYSPDQPRPDLPR